MIFREEAVITRLIEAARKDDPESSSHWNHYHRNFAVRADGSLEGLEGFGGCEAPYRGLNALKHWFFQRPYRRMASGFPAFQALDRIASGMTRAQGRAYDLDVLRQTITLAFLRTAVPQPWGTVGVIGDGFASMSTLLLASGFADRVILVNLNKTLLADAAFFRKWQTAESGMALCLIESAADLPAALERKGLVAVQAVNHSVLRKAPLDLVINIASMQEMNPSVTAAYFADMREAAQTRPLHFYCCNREEKRLFDGTVSRFSEYPWHPSDAVVIDELCPWHQQFYSLSRPFYRPYDGPHRHRLVRMTAAESASK
jgi:hypothetical protein